LLLLLVLLLAIGAIAITVVAIAVVAVTWCGAFGVAFAQVWDIQKNMADCISARVQRPHAVPVCSA
jgi:uncharacterized membrane protein